MDDIISLLNKCPFTADIIRMVPEFHIRVITGYSHVDFVSQLHIDNIDVILETFTLPYLSIALCVEDKFNKKVADHIIKRYKEGKLSLSGIVTLVENNPHFLSKNLSNEAYRCYGDKYTDEVFIYILSAIHDPNDDFELNKVLLSLNYNIHSTVAGLNGSESMVTSFIDDSDSDVMIFLLESAFKKSKERLLTVLKVIMKHTESTPADIHMCIVTGFIINYSLDEKGWIIEMLSIITELFGLSINELRKESDEGYIEALDAIYEEDV